MSHFSRFQSAQQAVSTPDRPGLAFLWMLLSAVGFSSMMIFVKNLAHEIPHFELVFFRSFVNFVLIAAWMLWRKEKFRSSHVKLLIFRGVVGFIGASCFFYAIIYLPISIAALINWISPLFVILFSWLFLKERVPNALFGWIAIAFLGLLLLLRPDLGSGNSAMPFVPVLIGFLGTAFAGLAYVAVRAAAARVGVNLIILYFTGTASLLALPFIAFEFEWPSAGQSIQLICSGIFASVGQVAMTQAYRYAAAGVVSSMSLMNAVFSAAWGFLLFDETFLPFQWLGMILVIFGVGQVARFSQAKTPVSRAPASIP